LHRQGRPAQGLAGGSLLALALLLAGCAAPAPTPDKSLAALPAGWQAALPHGGSEAQLQQWWARFDDPLLDELIRAAEAANPGLQQALARIAQARAAAGAASGARLPQLGLAGSATRGRSAVPSNEPARSQAGLSLDASWEIDLFARVRLQSQAAAERAAASGLDWHQAKVSLAAEVAQGYLGLRSCEQQLDLIERDGQALARIAGYARDKARVGLEAPAAAALLDGAAADAASRALAQRAECDIAVKGLVALTALDEPGLRERLAARRARLPAPERFAVPALPAALLAQRPDLAASERLVAAAWAERGAAEAERYPQLRLSGALTSGVLRVGGARDDGEGWSFGPSLSLPLFDGGQRRAGVDAAQARFDETLAAHRGQVLLALREVEEALVRLDAAAAREGHAQAGARGYEASFQATQERWQRGLASAAELEDARRLALNAQASLVQVQRERVGAWVALYKATGGGWSAAQ
jgi:NodT family efflux transporter outer membrane factor (OMF) lipoprotein